MVHTKRYILVLHTMRENGIYYFFRIVFVTQTNAILLSEVFVRLTEAKWTVKKLYVKLSEGT